MSISSQIRPHPDPNNRVKSALHTGTESWSWRWLCRGAWIKSHVTPLSNGVVFLITAVVLYLNPSMHQRNEIGFTQFLYPTHALLMELMVF